MRKRSEKYQIDEPEIPPDTIWWEDVWVYIVIAVGGFLFCLILGILGKA